MVEEVKIVTRMPGHFEVWQIRNVTRRTTVTDRYGDEVEEVEGTILGWIIKGTGRITIDDATFGRKIEWVKSDPADIEIRVVANKRQSILSALDETSDRHTAVGWRPL